MHPRPRNHILRHHGRSTTRTPAAASINPVKVDPAITAPAGTRTVTQLPAALEALLQDGFAGSLSDEIQVYEEQKDETAEEEVHVEELVVALGDVLRDDLGHGEGEAQDDEDLAVQSGDHGLKGVTEKVFFLI